MWCKISLITLLITTTIARDENVLMTEVFEIILDPPMFNWTYEDNSKQIVYQPSLRHCADLPQWINFVYSNRHNFGILYGVPPKSNKKVELDVVALNKRNYETRLETINIHISEKLNPSMYEVHMKIDNLNVEDMFDIERMESLKDIFRKQLWKESENDLYVTFLASATELGARKPRDPSECDGVVVRLGSQAMFSRLLTDLLEQVKPLRKLAGCPRYVKRTSLERHFRDVGFALDWCNFKLIHKNNSVHQQLNDKLKSTETFAQGRWETISKEQVPQRSYRREFVSSILIPVMVMIVLALILSFILCFHHEGISKRMKEDSDDNCYQKTAIQSATETLRSMSSNRDLNLSPDPALLSRCHDSPTSTTVRGMHLGFRPSPPPYIRPKFKPEF